MANIHRPRGGAAFCPACERFIGPAGTCHPTLRALRVGALILALVGFLLLHVMARSTDPPRVRTGTVTARMNYAWVCVNGTVVGEPFLGREEAVIDYVAFSLDDGSGRIRVCAHDDVARALIDAAAVPRPAETVDLSAIVHSGVGGRVQLRLRSARDLRLPDRWGDADGRKERPL